MEYQPGGQYKITIWINTDTKVKHTKKREHFQCLSRIRVPPLESGMQIGAETARELTQNQIAITEEKTEQHRLTGPDAICQ